MASPIHRSSNAHGLRCRLSDPVLVTVSSKIDQIITARLRGHFTECAKSSAHNASATDKRLFQLAAVSNGAITVFDAPWLLFISVMFMFHPVLVPVWSLLLMTGTATQIRRPVFRNDSPSAPSRNG